MNRAGRFARPTDYPVRIEVFMSAPNVGVSSPKSRDKVDPEIQAFLRSAVHDLRAGLRWINTTAEILESSVASKLDPASTELLERMRDSVRRMNAVVSGMSSYATASAVSNYSRRPVALQVPVQTAMASLAEETRAAGATFDIGELPWVYGDLNRFADLFRNLFSNSLKFRSADAPLIRVRAVPPRKTKSEQTFVTITVDDNGAGIEDRYRSGLFAPFHRLHGPEVPGVGLGLFIARQIVEAHGGKIEIQSKDKPGTLIEFTLPWAEEPESA